MIYGTPWTIICSDASYQALMYLQFDINILALRCYPKKGRGAWPGELFMEKLSINLTFRLRIHGVKAMFWLAEPRIAFNSYWRYGTKDLIHRLLENVRKREFLSTLFICCPYLFHHFDEFKTKTKWRQNTWGNIPPQVEPSAYTSELKSRYKFTFS
jgi:hypothetical protein